ncbi:MAG TPA: hypothetical protein VKU83_02215, partial [Puia sp.]|nr:hypothetical protein [Puia sp.]
AFKYVGGEYQLRIAAGIETGAIRFEVANSVPADLPANRQGGIGLDNLKRRLELLYPGRHCLTAGRKGDRFEAVLTIQYQ